MTEENSREFVSKNYAEFDTGKYSENKDITDLMVDNSEMYTFVTGTINKYGYWSFQSNIIADEKIPIVFTIVTTPLKTIQSKKHTGNYVDDYIASLMN